MEIIYILQFLNRWVKKTVFVNSLKFSNYWEGLLFLQLKTEISK